MSTTVFQDLQSCFEPKTLRLKLASPQSNTNTKQDNQMTKNLDMGGWNFLQTLPNYSQKSSHIEPFYSPLKLSQKSLELCTENLGSETGSDDTIDSSIFSTASKPSTRRQNREQVKKANPRSFPPPLTTISGTNSLQVRPRREGGRLVIEAVEAPTSGTCFEAERSHGRLQLRFLKNCEFFYDQTVTTEEEDDYSNIGEIENEDIVEDKRNSKNIVEEKDGLDMNGNRKEVKVEKGRENFQRHNRCKERGHGGSNGLRNWEAFWVAT